MGQSSAANVASMLKISYTGIELALVVGICGGVPYPPGNNEQEIFLGDVIISDSAIQYDFGKQYPSGFQHKTGVKEKIGRPSQEIMSMLASLRSKAGRQQLEVETMRHLRLFQQSQGLPLPESDDILFASSFIHRHPDKKGSECAC
ncbi:hypothetical protein N7493_007072 [Penicillium malachiteum]|uniref:Nucleoside phosphorylase domain-containing protein n=1 Tax=Penicillium malachiteum TaxID=1324776 RepID=A0AAD6HJY4_9EURO|nr:hypothetical protein N7493_007072 [Penicillium malachiteum]